VELRVLRRYRYTWAMLGIGLVALTLFAGRSVTGSGPRLWLGGGGFLFQPSEVLKLLVAVFLAGYLADRRELLAEASTGLGRLRLPPLPYLAPLAVMLGLSLVLLAAQRDLGAALLVFALALGMLYVASSRLDYVLASLALFGTGAFLLHQRIAVIQDRVRIWLDPWSESQGTGHQIVQSLMAIGAGGVMGAGLGQGSPTVIPAVWTDFVYAAIAEELGMAGSLAVLALYALLTLRGFKIAVEAGPVFERLLAAGLTLGLALQALIIVGGVVKLIPLTGITLPFLSYGGTSLMTSSVAVGLLLRISEREPAR
jgi:cell division protein FtsW (lipid II flippase)